MKEPAMHPLTSAPKARPRTEATIVSNEEDFHEVLHVQGDPARPTFAADITETQSAIMSKQVAYWTDLLGGYGDHRHGAGFCW